VPTLTFCCCASCGINQIGAASALRHWNSVTGTAPTVETTNPHVAGGYYYRWNTVGAAAQRIMDILTGPVQEAVARIAFRFPTLPGADVCIAGWSIGAGGAPLLRFRSATQDICGSVGSNNSATPFGIVANVWYVADLYASTDATRSMSARIIETDGTTHDLGEATSGAAAANMSGFRIGLGCTGVGEQVEAVLDVTSIAHSLTGADYPIGLGYGIGLRPRADGTHSFSASTDFEYNDTTGISPSATDTWTYIDDLLDNITDFLAIPGAAAAEYLEWLLDAMPSGVASVNGVEVVSAHHASGTTANKQTMRLVDEASESDVFTDADFSFTSIAFNTQQVATAPSGGAWTTAKLDALKLRWGSSWTTADISPVPYIDALVLEVDFVPSSSGPQATVPIMPMHLVTM
jgi:hypothetical protein